MTETYMQKRYRTDSNFREKQLKYSRKYFPEHSQQVNKTARIRYANRTPEQISARKEYLIKLRRSEKWKNIEKNP